MQRFISALKDSAIALIILLVFHPFGLVGDRQSVIYAVIGMTVIFFLSSILTSCFTSYLVNKMVGKKEEPCYKDEIRKLGIQYLLNTPILASVVASYLSWQLRGDVRVIWKMGDSYTLLPLITMVGGIALIYVPLYIYNRIQIKKRFLQAEVEELQNLNALLEQEHQMLRSRLTKDNVTDKIIIHSDSRESLIVNPPDIVYVESVGNYLNIVYFDESELRQKRLRSSLKEIEETLEAFPFMIHTHRAFLVNINYITQVSGNSAGYKVSLFSTDRVLPVSKANVAMFREKITELGRDLK